MKRIAAMVVLLAVVAVAGFGQMGGFSIHVPEDWSPTEYARLPELVDLGVTFETTPFDWKALGNTPWPSYYVYDEDTREPLEWLPIRPKEPDFEMFSLDDEQVSGLVQEYLDGIPEPGFLGRKLGLGWALWQPTVYSGEGGSILHNIFPQKEKTLEEKVRELRRQVCEIPIKPDWVIFEVGIDIGGVSASVSLEYSIDELKCEEFESSDEQASQ